MWVGDCVWVQASWSSLLPSTGALPRSVWQQPFLSPHFHDMSLFIMRVIFLSGCLHAHLWIFFSSWRFAGPSTQNHSAMCEVHIQREREREKEGRAGRLQTGARVRNIWWDEEWGGGRQGETRQLKQNEEKNEREQADGHEGLCLRGTGGKR